jgi:putative ABC transport system permease protein
VAYALDAIRRRPGRSALTAIGVGLAVGLVVLLLALSAGIETSASELATQSGVDLLMVSANTSLAAGSGFPPVPGAHDLASAVPHADPNVATASPWLVSDLVFGNASLWAAANRSDVPSSWSPTGSGAVGWIPDDNGGIETPPVYNGTGFTAAGDPHFANGSYAGPRTGQIELDQSLAVILRVDVGDLVWVRPAPPTGPAALAGWYANATAFRVVGVTGPFWLVPSALLAFLYLSELQSLVGGATASTDYASLILIHLHDPSNPASDQSTLAAAFPGLTVFTLANILGAVQDVVNLYQTFGVLIGVIGLVVATLFTTTVLQMSVDDRSREIALLRAVGHTRASIGLLVVEEACVLGTLGLAVGLPVAYLGALAINGFLLRLLVGLPAGFSFVSFDSTVVAAGVVLVVGIGLVAAIAPAARAVQLPVAQELGAP